MGKDDSCIKYVIQKLVMSFVSEFHNQLSYVVYTIDGLVVKFFDYFNQQYEAALGTDFEKMDLVNQMDYLKHIYKV